METFGFQLTLFQALCAAVALRLVLRFLFRCYVLLRTFLASSPMSYFFGVLEPLVPAFSLSEQDFFTLDECTPEVQALRRDGFQRLGAAFLAPSQTDVCLYN